MLFLSHIAAQDHGVLESLAIPVSLHDLTLALIISRGESAGMSNEPAVQWWGTGQEILQGVVRSEAGTVSGGADRPAIRAALSPPGIEPASNGM